MDAQELRNLQEAYMEVVMNEGKIPLPTEKMKRKIENIKSSMKSTLEKSAAEVGMNPKRVKFPFSPEDREKYLKYEKRVDNISKNLKKEQVDIYDIILSHLLDEGYAETLEAAEVMMVNMSKDWRQSIMEMKVSKKQQKKDAKTREKWYGEKSIERGTDRFSQLQKKALKSAKTKLF